MQIIPFRLCDMSIFASPATAAPLRWVRNLLVDAGLLRRKYEEQFTDIYVRRYWGSSESASGGGSNASSTRVIREALPLVFAKKGIKSLLDAPCGDYHWMRSIDLRGIEYTGGDIVALLIEENRKKYQRPGIFFVHLDVIHDSLPAADLVLCRDCLVHLPLADATKALRNIARSGSKWLLTTTFTARSENKEIAPGKWRPLNLQIAPFHLPDPDELINEECADADGAYADKSLGLWSCDSIRQAIG